MRFEIAWDPAALGAWKKLFPHPAMIVDRAVIRFAERGEGHLEWVAPYYRLRAGLYDVALTIERDKGRINVIRIYRMR